MEENITMEQIMVPLKNEFFELVKELTAGELRTLALLLSYRADFVIYEEVVARQQDINRKTVERRFKTLLDKGFICKIHKPNTSRNKLGFAWTLSLGTKKYRADVGQKKYTKFERSFILNKDINDFDWLVLSIMLCNKSDYKNYLINIREQLLIPEEKRSRITKSTDRLVDQNLIVKNKESNNMTYCVLTEKAESFVARADRTKYTTQEEKIKERADKIKRKGEIILGTPRHLLDNPYNEED